MEVPGSTQTHTRQTEADRAGAIYFVRRKFCFMWRGGRNSGPGYRYDVSLQGLYGGSVQLLKLAYLWDPP